MGLSGQGKKGCRKQKGTGWFGRQEGVLVSCCGDDKIDDVSKGDGSFEERRKKGGEETVSVNLEMS